MGLTAIGGVGVAYAAVEAQCYVLRRVVVPMLAAGAAPLRVLHLSDLHMTLDTRGARRAEWVRGLAVERPDLVVVTGDNFARGRALPVILDALAPFFDTPGAFVFGSNDYVSARWRNPARYLVSRLLGRGAHDNGEHLVERDFDLPWDQLRAALVRAGWFDLNNARADAVVAGHQVRLVGLDDPHIDRDNLPTPQGGSSAEVRAAIVLGVVHSPYRRALRALADDGAGLILAGHTHGGQLALPGYGALVANCDVGTDRVRGLHGWPGPRPDEADGGESVWLHVSAGLGTSPYVPLRLAARPEATLLTLTASDIDP
ncbi:MAG: metallophosphoesterase [Bifidobacteriaceae bacterium]|nr:metallophosphoesterase [Bifidobacteriaceae bacterium]